MRYQIPDCVPYPVPYPVVVKNKNAYCVCLFVGNSEEIGGVETQHDDEVLTLSGVYATYRRLIGGLVAYVDKQLFAVDHEIKKRIVGNDVIITIKVKGVAGKMMSQDRVMVPSGALASYGNLVGGLIAFVGKYLFAVDHEIDRRIIGNDVVIKIRIKDVADKMMRRRRR